MPFCLFLHAQASWPKKKKSAVAQNEWKDGLNGIRSNGKHCALNLKNIYIQSGLICPDVLDLTKLGCATSETLAGLHRTHPHSRMCRRRFVRKLTVSRQRWPMLTLTSQISDSSYFFRSSPVNSFTFYGVLRCVWHVVCTQRPTNWLFRFGFKRSPNYAKTCLLCGKT